MITTIRPAGPDDLPAVARIYGHAVRTSIATFDLEDPPAPQWAAKAADTDPGHHLLVAVRAGTVVGFATAAAFRPRPAYARTVETSIYLAPDATGGGLGTTLYGRLLELIEQDGMHVAVAVIALPNPASVALHERCGFRPAGVLPQVGHKFGRWIDIAWYHRTLAADPA